MGIKITGYNIICNLGIDVNEAFKKALDGDNSCFDISYDVIKSKKTRLGRINHPLPSVNCEEYNLRCNGILLKCLEGVDLERLFQKYDKEKIGVIVANTNTGVQEFETSNNVNHARISNPASFLKEYLKLDNYCAAVSTACSSGIKAFSTAVDLINSGFSDAFIVAGVDEISKVPVFGFDSLEILSDEASIPFSKNRKGMNIGEGAGIFILEKDSKEGIEILGIGETTDFYHSTTPDPEAKEAIIAIEDALLQAGLKPNEIDYINLHGTGTEANDLMEAIAVNKIFKDRVWASSTKPLTGHCLGAAASVEIGLCCKLIENAQTKVFPHVYDDRYDESLPKIKLASTDMVTKKVKRILCTSFGFGGTNTAIILGVRDE